MSLNKRLELKASSYWKINSIMHFKNARYSKRCVTSLHMELFMMVPILSIRRNALYFLSLSALFKDVKDSRSASLHTAQRDFNEKALVL
jgi:hypothetical protein